MTVYWYQSETDLGVYAVAGIHFPDENHANYRLDVTLDCKVANFVPLVYCFDFNSLSDALKQLANGFDNLKFSPVMGLEQDAPMLDSYRVV